MRWKKTTGFLWTFLFKERQERLRIKISPHSSTQLQSLSNGHKEYYDYADEPREITNIISLIEVEGKEMKVKALRNDNTLKGQPLVRYFQPYLFVCPIFKIVLLITLGEIQILVTTHKSNLENQLVMEFENNLLEALSNYFHNVWASQSS